MDVAAFENSPMGTLVPISGFDGRRGEGYEHFAFLPHPLPAHVGLKPQTYRCAAEATAAVARLDQAASRLPNPWLLARPAIRREAVGTSALEGTYAGLDEVMEADYLDQGDLSPSVAEVVNYVRAAETAFDWISDRPITIAMLAELQKILVRGTSGDNSEAGRIRTVQAFTGRRDAHVREARFIPPPPGDQLVAGVEEWQRWLDADNDELTIVKLALGHYQFETLHPFNDGNGRLGRLVCTLQLAVEGELRSPVLSISPWLVDRRDDYQSHLLELSQTGHFDPWVRFFCEAVRVQALGAVERIEALLDWKQATTERLRIGRLRGVAVSIAEELIGYPVITPTSAARRHGVSYPAANTAIKRLEAMGLLRERTGRRYARLYVAADVLKIIGS